MNRNFALEANYIDFGKASAPAFGTVGPYEVKAKGYSAYGVGLAPIGPVDLFLKAGIARLDADGKIGAVLFEDKKTEFAYGAGSAAAARTICDPRRIREVRHRCRR